MFVLSGWIIDGYILYFSKDNTCPTDMPMIFMVFTIFTGIFMVLAMACLICLLPVLFVNWRNSQRDQEGDSESIIATLSKKFYDPSKYSHSSQCIICMEDYKPTDNVSQLKCNEKHYFHHSCLSTWIK